MRVKPWMALVFILVKLMGAFVSPPQVGDGHAVSRHGCVYYSVIKTCFKFGVFGRDSCKVCSLFLFHPQVASARLRGLIERPQFIGSSIETLLFGNFSTWSDIKKHSCIFLVLYCIVYFSLLNLCPPGEEDLRPRSTHCRALDVKVWQVIVSASGLVVATTQAVRAFKASSEGKIRAAVAKAMKPFEPSRPQDEVIQRPVMGTIQKRVECWRQHATIIGGRYQSGKSVATEEALRGVRGVVRFTIKSADWETTIYEELKVENSGLFKEMMRRVGEKLKDFPDNLTKYPVLLLDIPRTTIEGLSGQQFFFQIL